MFHHYGLNTSQVPYNLVLTTKFNQRTINNLACIIDNKMIYISQESLNFSLSDKTLTFQTNQLLTVIENIQDGCQ